MALKGSIEDFNISEIIQFIGHQSKTGILTVRWGNKEIRVFFVNGKVVRVEPDRSEHKILIGEMLIRSGKLTREQLENALEEQKGNVQYLGEILLRRKFVSKEDIQKAVQTQIYETIYNLSQLKEGTFEFETSEKSKYLKNLPSLSPDQLLLNVSWMMDEWQEIKKIIPTMSVVFDKITKKHSIFSDDDQEDKGMTFNQKIVYDLVDGKRTVYDIIEKSMMGRFDTCGILAELLRQGYIRKAGVENVPIYKRIEIRSSKFLFDFLSVVLILLSVYFSIRYVNWLATFKTRHASEIRAVEESHIKNVVIPTLYQKYLSYRLETQAYPSSLLALSARGYISKKEAEVVRPELIRDYLAIWKKDSHY